MTNIFIKRLFDIFFSIIGLVFFLPIIFVLAILIFIQDFKSPLYITQRSGKNGKIFKMIKLRTMIVGADSSGVSSTSSSDDRITSLGGVIRKFKFDELCQLLNVLIGSMSFVGPRPNLISETNKYDSEEKNLLRLKPGITDFSSIVFSDEGDILKNYIDPNKAYEELIKTHKNKLGLIYIYNNNVILDVKIIIYTLLGIISKKTALFYVVKELKALNVEKELIQVASRIDRLENFKR